MSNARPRIRVGVDVDGVLYPFDPAFRQLARWKFGLDLPESTSWGSIRQALTNNQWLWFWSAGVKHGLFRNSAPYDGALDGLTRLAEIADLVLITHRPAQAAQDTFDWVAHYRLPVLGLNILCDGQDKTLIPAEVYVDDKPENVEIIGQQGKIGLLWTRPWNQSWSLDLAQALFAVHRVENWEQVIEHVRLCGERLRPA